MPITSLFGFWSLNSICLFGLPLQIPIHSLLVTHKGTVFGFSSTSSLRRKNGSKTSFQKQRQGSSVGTWKLRSCLWTILMLLYSSRFSLMIIDFLFSFCWTFRKFLCICVMLVCLLGFTVFLLSLYFYGKFFIFFIFIAFGVGCMHTLKALVG